MRKILFLFYFFWGVVNAQTKTQTLAPTPPMGWMTWNYFGENINEKIIREVADSMESSGMVRAGYCYIMIDDGWQGGRDNRNRIIPDPQKFPSGIKALADYLHQKGMKLGIYSDAAPLTCVGYTASLHFEDLDAQTFASWGIDYLKYDYCHAPSDSSTAISRYGKMSSALQKSGREIVFSVCEWGERKPWLWAAKAGGQLWRTTFDIRDNWNLMMKIVDVNAPLHPYAGPGKWNDPDMLIVGLRGKSGPAREYGGTGCSDTEYRTQMSLWAMMAAPLIATNDVRFMDKATRELLLNPEVIAVNQDALGRQAYPLFMGDSIQLFVKPLMNGDTAIAILNRSLSTKEVNLSFASIGLTGKYQLRDCWERKNLSNTSHWKGILEGHETKLLLLH